MRVFLFCSILLFHLSCNTTPPKDVTNFRLLITDTSLDQFNDLEFGKWRSSMMNLPQIYKGVDSFELRVWNFGAWHPWEVVSLRCLNNRWILCNYTYQVNSLNIVDSIGVSCKQIPPHIAVKIQSSFIQDSVLNLPSQTSIPNFKDSTADGGTYFIEIATKNFYKTLGYHNPQYFNDRYNKQFLQLLRFWDVHFKLLQTYSPGSDPSLLTVEPDTK